MASGKTPFDRYDLIPLKDMVQHSSPDRIREVGQHWVSVHQELTQVAADLQAAVQHATTHWDGAAAQGFAQKGGQIQESLVNTAAHAQNTSVAMNYAATALQQTKSTMSSIKVPDFWDRVGKTLSDGFASSDEGFKRDIASGMNRIDAVNKNAHDLSATEVAHQYAIGVMEHLGPQYIQAADYLDHPPSEKPVDSSKPFPPAPTNPVPPPGHTPPSMPMPKYPEGPPQQTPPQQVVPGPPDGPKPTPWHPTGPVQPPGGPIVPPGGPVIAPPVQPPGTEITGLPPLTGTPTGPGGPGIGMPGGPGTIPGPGGGGGGGLSGGGGGGGGYVPGLGGGGGFVPAGGAGGGRVGGGGLSGAGGAGGAAGGRAGGAAGAGGAGSAAGKGAAGAGGMGAMHGGGMGGGGGAGSKGGGKNSGLVRKAGGTVGNAKGGAGGRSFTQGGSGIGKGRGNGQAGAGGMHGAPGSGSGGRKKKGEGHRPDYLIEDEETWRGGTANPPVIE
ncbi:WXG100 family type VII secretion target [Kitasatospora sp. NPDC049285]|uniref:WXG100 family type VII secretion target n=1 Tax=Kitasatospora sp. NPDC049285 TaxID=3157096 RepID=UPI00343755CE